jgi:Leucine-rich repeat (LRR) protein
MKALNPGFDGNVASKVENKVVTALAFKADDVSDISAVRVLKGLQSLDCSGSDLGSGRLSDLAPLRGLPLTYLNCRYTRVSDLAPLKGMALTLLDLRHTNVGDADAKHLAGLTHLRYLSLWGTRVQGPGLKHLAGLKNLELLSLENTQVTDAGLKGLAGLPRLAELSLYSVMQVTDAGLEELAGLGSLRFLDLRGTQVTDAGARKLACVVPSLRIYSQGGLIEPREGLDPDRRAAEYVLAIGGTVQVNAAGKQVRTVADLPRGAFRLTHAAAAGDRWLRDAGLANFKGCKDLVELSLNNARVSNAGLAHLAGCTSLTNLDLGGTQVSDLSPLKGMIALKRLGLGDLARLTDLSPLKGLPLEHIEFSNFKAQRDAPTLRAITTLKTINGKPAAGFWVEAGK